MRKQLKKEFVDALKKAVDECGSQSELARRSGVGQATINSIINDKNRRGILDSIMQKLYPFVEKFMPSNIINIENNSGTSVGVVNGEVHLNEGKDSGIPADILRAIIADRSLSPAEKAQLIKEIMK